MASEAKNKKVKKVSQDVPLLRRDKTTPGQPVRKPARAHIQQHTKNGAFYYTYRRGTDKEIYLGTAEAILKAVKGQEKDN